MIKLKTNLLLLFFAILMIGCREGNVDLTPPSMQVISFTPEPITDEVCGSSDPMVFHLTGGDELVYDVIFQDDEALSQYKVDIHNNFDCHGHAGGSAPSIVVPSVNNQTVDWSVLNIQDLNGTSSSVMQALEVPTNVTTGFYHFQIQVIDESGNDNPAANFFTLNIKNPTDSVRPQIMVELPSMNNFVAAKGETIQFKGMVTDERSLSDGGNGVLYLSYTDLSSGNTFSTDEVFPFDENVDLTFEFNFQYQVPQTLVPGDYRFSLGANDGVRNVAPFVFWEVEIQ